jgi:SAM-dependent methyltransferase
MDFDEKYRSWKHYFGVEPNPVLDKYHTRIDKSQRILDLGAGQGRNTLFLARKGYGVDAVEPSQVAIEMISTESALEDLDIRTYHCGFDTFIPQTDSYSAILALGLIQLLSWESIQLLVERIAAWTRPGSLVFVMAFTKKDPTYDRFKRSQEWSLAGKNSFVHREEGYRTYLESGELLTLFADYKAVYHREGLGREHRHGDGKVTRHVWAEGVFQKVE